MSSPSAASGDPSAPSDPKLPLEAAAFLAAIVQSSDDAIITNTLDSTVITWNAGAEHMFGYTAAEMVGGSITRLLPAGGLHEESELISQLVLGNAISHFETRRIRKDGSVIDISLLLNGSGEG